ncbi:MAG: hypothetical protein AAFY54_15430 [Cyanobacteria bacterium J06648_10]
MNERNNTGGIGSGIGLLLLCHLFAEFLLFVLGIFFPYNLFVPGTSHPLSEWIFAAMIFIGITQLLYGVPLCIWLYRRRRLETMKGVAVGMLLTFLLNGGCYALFWIRW